MRDAIIGVFGGFVLLVICITAANPETPTLQEIFEDVERFKAARQLKAQEEQARKTIESNRESRRVK